MANQIRLRPLQPGDDKAIARIAAETPGFSVPSKYIIWMLATTQGDLCRVATDELDEVIGYTLAFRTFEVEVGFSWQTAVGPEYRSRHVAAALIAHIAAAAKAGGISTVRFTNVSAQAETMATLVSAAGIGQIEQGREIPPAWGIDEVEVEFRLNEP